MGLFGKRESKPEVVVLQEGMLSLAPARSGSDLTVTLIGNLNGVTAPLLEDYVSGLDAGIAALHMNFSRLEYISSAGLRVLLQCMRLLERRGAKMNITDVPDNIREILTISGFGVLLEMN